MAVKVGDTLYGFCNGYFGRDSYGDKRIVAMGKDRGFRFRMWFVKLGYVIRYGTWYR